MKGPREVAQEIALQALLGALAVRRRRISLLIRATEQAQDEHRTRGRGIEAAACAIRIKALRDALATLQDPE